MKKIFRALGLLTLGVLQNVAFGQSYFFVPNYPKAKVQAPQDYKYVGQTPSLPGATAIGVFAKDLTDTKPHKYKAYIAYAGTQAKVIPGFNYIGQTQPDESGIFNVYESVE
ncbi:MAG TPA: hypothetical protein VHA52_00615 [Candidatus Babeliaceae bacterium]|nr:hypothetical protein [Candidatus Babeliaceae bacterium]